MRDLPQAEHCDLGLNPEADHTENLCPQKCENPGGHRGFAEQEQPT